MKTLLKHLLILGTPILWRKYQQRRRKRMSTSGHRLQSAKGGATTVIDSIRNALRVVLASIIVQERAGV
jgi:hypothetical protein